MMALLWLTQRVTYAHLKLNTKIKKQYNLFITCVNSVIEIPLSIQCKIPQYKFLWQYPIKVKDLFSLGKIHPDPAWIQVDCRSVGSPETRLFKPAYLKTEKHGLKHEILLCKIYFKLLNACNTYQD